MKKDLPIYDIKLSDDTQGVGFISLVDEPAIGVDWIKLAKVTIKQEPKKVNSMMARKALGTLDGSGCFGCPPNGDGTRVNGEPDGRCKGDDSGKEGGGSSGKSGNTAQSDGSTAKVSTVEVESNTRATGIDKIKVSVEMPNGTKYLNNDIKKEALNRISNSQGSMLEIKANHGVNSKAASTSSGTRVRYNDGTTIHIWYKDGQGTGRLDNKDWIYKTDTTDRWSTKDGWSSDSVAP